MDIQKVDMFLIANGKYFESFNIPMIRERLITTDDSNWVRLQSTNLKDPTVSIIISVVGGHFGIDRFYIGDVGLGIAKLLTCGGLGIWSIVDWFLIMKATRQKNMEKLQMFLF